jgi:hypothetical protein
MHGINTYYCQTCKGSIVTIDRDEGVTPFMLSCLATEGCDGVMRSAMYAFQPGAKPMWEWYKPASTKGFDQWTREHVEKGGLVLQRIPADTNITDPNLRSIVDYISGLEKVSPVMIQRRFKMTWMTASRYVDLLIKLRYVEEKKDSKAFHKVIPQNEVIKDFQADGTTDSE